MTKLETEVRDWQTKTWSTSITDRMDIISTWKTKNLTPEKELYRWNILKLNWQS